MLLRRLFRVGVGPAGNIRQSRAYLVLVAVLGESISFVSWGDPITELSLIFLWRGDV